MCVHQARLVLVERRKPSPVIVGGAVWAIMASGSAEAAITEFRRLRARRGEVGASPAQRRVTVL